MAIRGQRTWADEGIGTKGPETFSYDDKCLWSLNLWHAARHTDDDVAVASFNQSKQRTATR
jgi:hypothetical protein